MTLQFITKRIKEQYDYLSDLQYRDDISNIRRSELGFSALQQLEYYEKEKKIIRLKEKSQNKSLLQIFYNLFKSKQTPRVTTRKL